MTPLRHILAVTTAFVGLVGFALSLYAIVHIWFTANRLGREIPEALGRLHHVMASVHSRAEIAADVVRATRGQLHSVQTTVEDLSTDAAERQIPSVLDTVDAEVMEGLERTEEFVRSMQASLEGASGAVVVMESIPFLGPRLAQPTGDSEGNLRNLATSLNEMARALDQVTRILAEIRTRRTIGPGQVARLQYALARVDEQLHDVQTEVEQFSAGVEGVAARLAHAQRNSPRRIRRAAGFATLFFICFGASQLHLLVQGCRSLRGRATDMNQDLTASNGVA